MATHTADLSWALKEGDDFARGRFGRGHTLRFDGGVTVPASAAPSVVGKWAVPEAVDPEEMLVASLSSCHMLTFLALCAKARVEVTRYEDHAESILDTVEKVTWVAEIHLKPTIRVARGTSKAKVEELFEKAHKYCFVANSIKSKVVMAPTVVEA